MDKKSTCLVFGILQIYRLSEDEANSISQSTVLYMTETEWLQMVKTRKQAQKSFVFCYLESLWKSIDSDVKICNKDTTPQIPL